MGETLRPHEAEEASTEAIIAYIHSMHRLDDSLKALAVRELDTYPWVKARVEKILQRTHEGKMDEVGNLEDSLINDLEQVAEGKPV
jgi:hypothetical protein